MRTEFFDSWLCFRYGQNCQACRDQGSDGMAWRANIYRMFGGLNPEWGCPFGVEWGGENQRSSIGLNELPGIMDEIESSDCCDGAKELLAVTRKTIGHSNNGKCWERRQYARVAAAYEMEKRRKSPSAKENPVTADDKLFMNTTEQHDMTQQHKT